jgi:hypothetical protein
MHAYQPITIYIDHPPSQSPLPSPILPNNGPIPTMSSVEFLRIVEDVREAIANDIHPRRIAQGSSGSYFCKNQQGKVVGVFKPKDEEPYGRLNPKWTKWIHKNLFPCCFGRSCLIPNFGYLSEAGASLIDRRLGLQVCPRTEVVSLSSESFYYPRNSSPYPKMGSFQIFLDNFKDATSFFREGYRQLVRNTSTSSISSTHSSTSSFMTAPPVALSPRTQKEFQLGFERLVILDYLIRNTDRGSDNWMIQYTPEELTESSTSNESKELTQVSQDTGMTLRVAAIDHGLAFPYKHPDNWRSYPYHWTFLPCARVPFSQETKDLILPQLTSAEWWSRTMDELEHLFRLDSDFSEAMWRKQRAVIRGQGYNLVEVLNQADPSLCCPFALVQRPPVAVYEEHEEEEGFLNGARRRLKKVKQRFETFTRNRPWFSWC